MVNQKTLFIYQPVRNQRRAPPPWGLTLGASSCWNPWNHNLPSCHLHCISWAPGLWTFPVVTVPSNLDIPFMTPGIDDVTLHLPDHESLLYSLWWETFSFYSSWTHLELPRPCQFVQVNLFKAVCFSPPNWARCFLQKCSLIKHMLFWSFLFRK